MRTAFLKKASNSSPGDSRHHSNLTNLTKGVIDAECPPWLPSCHFLTDNPLDGFPSGLQATAAECRVNFPLVQKVVVLFSGSKFQRQLKGNAPLWTAILRTKGGLWEGQPVCMHSPMHSCGYCCGYCIWSTTRRASSGVRTRREQAQPFWS